MLTSENDRIADTILQSLQPQEQPQLKLENDMLYILQDLINDPEYFTKLSDNYRQRIASALSKVRRDNKEE